MQSKKNIIISIIIVILGTFFQILYNVTSQSKHDSIYQEILLNTAKIHFENIMLKKAQGLDPKLDITNKLTNVKFQVINSEKNSLEVDKNIIKRLKTTREKEYFEFNENRDYFYYYSVLDVKPSCISCHNIYKVGEVAGGMKISVPTSDYEQLYENLFSSKKLYVTLNIIFAVIIVILIVWFLNKNRQKHNDLVRSQRNLEKAEEMANLGHWRLDMRTGELSLSKNMKKILGVDGDNLTLEDIFDKVISKKDKKNIFRAFLESHKNKKNVKVEFQLRRQNDKDCRHVDCQIVYILDEDGKIIVSLGTIQDVTDFKKLRNELAILKQAVEQAPISIVITNEKGNIEYVNPSFTKTTGYKFEEVIGQTPRILKSEYTKDSEYEKLWADISSGKTWSGTFKNINKEGKEFWELAFISPVYSSKTNKISKYIAVKEEITEELYLKQELKDKEDLMIAQSRHAAMGEMISMIAHQWRQPATVISLCANNILIDVQLDMIEKESLLRNSEDIINQTTYLSHTIDNFRNFFKPNKAKTEVTVSEVIDEAMVMMRATLENHDIDFLETYESNEKFVTYEKELMQVFINIIKNAQEILKEKETPNKKITIREYNKDDNIIIEICDSAGGISENNLNKIFEPYFTTKDEMNGTGLGLYISKVIIEKHLNGSITAFNKDDGACFQIILKKGEL